MMIRLKKAVSFLLVVVMLQSLLLLSAFATDDGFVPIRNTLHDNDAYDLSLSFPATTLNDGKVWVNKSVSNNTINMLDTNGEPFHLSEAQVAAASAGDEDFVVALSALAQNFKSYTDTEDRIDLNVVFVMDVSTSMNNAMTPFTASSPTRLSVLQPAANSFIDVLAQLGEETTVNLAMITYMGSATTVFNWGQLGNNDATLAANKAEAHNVIANIRNANSKYYYPVSYTNAQAGLFLANYMYDTTNDVPKPDNIEAETTQNFVIFMSDGGPNRWLLHPDTVRVTKNNDGFYRLPSVVGTDLSENIVNTDYRHDAATNALDEVAKTSNINNITTYSLGLCSWFTSEANTSKFPTAVNFLKLCAAVGNKVIDAEEAKTYCGTNIPNGTMPGQGCPSYPEYDERDFRVSNTWRIRERKNGAEVTHTYTTLAEFEAVFEEKFGDLETRKANGIYSIPNELDVLISNYYAGNTADKFHASFQDIAYHISMSISDFVTSVGNASAADISGYIHLSDEIGEYMEVKNINGVFHNGTLYTGIEFAKKFSTLDWLDEDSVTNDTFRHSLYDRCGIPSDTASLRQVFSGAINAGTIYYNSDTDYGCDLMWYSDVSRNYLGMYYDPQGNVNEPPEGAVYRISSYMTWGSAKGTAGPDASMFFLTVAIAENLTYDRQVVIMDVPASLVPVRLVEVVFDENHPTGIAQVDNDAMPISLFYTVGLKENVSNVRDDYEYIHADSDGNTVYDFYSNQWSDNLYYPGGHPAYASFTPNEMNPFYYNAYEESTIYVYDSASAEYVPATSFDMSEEYYFKTTYHDLTGVHTTFVRLYGEYETLGVDIDPSKYIYVNEDDGILYGKVGAPRISEHNYTQLDKTFFPEGNVSHSESFYKHFIYNLKASIEADHYVPYGTDIIIQLGNNGVLELNNVDLKIKKIWDDGNNALGTRPESITLNVTRDGVEYDTLTLSADDCVVNGNEWEYTYNVPFGYDYQVAETPIEGYKTTYSEDTFTISNTLSDEDYMVLDYGLATTWLLPDTMYGYKVVSAQVDNENSDLSFGTAQINVNGDVLYTPATTSWDGYDTVNCLLTVNDAASTQVRYKLYVMPATNLYFEEDFLTFTDGTATWNNIGSKELISAQDGTNSNIYGYDAAYTNDTGYSGGCAKITTVTDGTSTWPTAYFEFYGTMTDIISHTSGGSGLMTVSVKNLDTNKTVKNYAINTFYDDAGRYGTFYQIPVLRCDMQAYAHYGVTLTAAYSAYFDKTGTGSYNVCVDAVRIYNPAGNNLTSGIIYDAYTAQNELNPVYGQLRDCLLSADGAFQTVGGANGIMYVACENGATSVQSYSKPGPNHEIYLESNNAIAFRLSGYGEGDRVHISTKSPSLDGTPTLYVNGSVIDSFNSASEQYYDITPYIGADGLVVVSNGGDGVLSLVDYKIISGAGVQELSIVADEEVLRSATAIMSAQPGIIQSFSLPETLDFNSILYFDEAQYPFTLSLDSSSFKVSKQYGEWVASAYIYADTDASLEQAVTDAGVPAQYKSLSNRQLLTAKWVDGEWITNDVMFSFASPEVISPGSGELSGIIEKLINLLVQFFMRILGINE